MKIDSPLYCPSFNEFEWVTLYSVDTQNNPKLLSLFFFPSLLPLSLSLSLPYFDDLGVGNALYRAGLSCSRSFRTSVVH